MASKEEEEPHNPTTRSQTANRKRSLSQDVNDISYTTKKRSTSTTDTDLNETTTSNQTTDDITATLSEVSNTSNDIPTTVTELFEEIDEKNTVDSGQTIDIESIDPPASSRPTTNTTATTKTESAEPMIPTAASNEVNEQTEAAETPASKPIESTSISTPNEAKGHTEWRPSDEGNQPSDSLIAATPIERDTTTAIVANDTTVVASTTIPETTPTAAAQTSKKYHPGLTVPDKSSAVRQPFSDKFFITDEAYEAYSHDSFMSTIDSIAKKTNKPGLALSLERPTSSVSRPPPSMQPAHHHHHQQQQQHQRSSHPHGTTNMTATAKPSSATPDNNRSNHSPTTTTTTTTTKNNNILDSLLDSISKNDRPVLKPTHVPSDIEIAMQAADLPQE